MRRRALAALTAAILGPCWLARGSVPVEQVEAYDPDDSPPAPTGYAPLNFNNLSSITLGPGDLGGGFDGITLFNAVPGSDPVYTESGHANLVAHYFYAQGTPAYPFVTDVYCAQADNFLNNIVLAQNDVSDSGPVPLGFAGGAKVISNTYIGNGTTGQTVDLQRRYDFMAAQGDAVVVSAAVTVSSDNETTYMVWSGFNCLAVSGVQSFDPAGSPGKQHADLYLGLDASFATAVVASDATGLIGTAQAEGSTDGQHAAVVRSLLMTSADKSVYTRGTANNLDPIHGAGTPDYPAALSVLQNGEQPLSTVTNGTITGAVTDNPKGWAYGSVAAGGASALVIDVPQAITQVTASLNWDVTSNQPTPDTIDTTDAGLIFPNLTFALQLLNRTGSDYTDTTLQTDPDLNSAVPGDNVQYLYSTRTIPAGTYALVVGGDPNLPASFAVSYILRGSFASNWNTSAGGSWGVVGNWTNGIPDNQAAVADFSLVAGLTGPVTVTLDGNRTVGQLNFTSPVGCTIAAGTGGALTIDDTGDSTGTANPMINVAAGSPSVTAPVSLAGGVNVAVAAGATLSVYGNITGTGGLVKSGPGGLFLDGTNSYGDTTVNGGKLSLWGAGSISGALTVSNGSSAVFYTGAGSTPLVYSINGLNVSGGSVVLQSPTTHAGRSLLVTSSVSVSGNGTVDLSANDMDVTGGALAGVTALVAAGYNLAGGADWQGAGITSSAAAADGTHLTALGAVQNNQSGAPLFDAANPFDGYTPGAGDILVKYTWFGDANLDGVVDGSDYSLIDNGYASGGALTGWYNGDFNYDGVIDGSDYALIDNAFNNQSAVLSSSAEAAEIAAQTAAVPEPASLLALGLVLVPRRRRWCQSQSRTPATGLGPAV